MADYTYDEMKVCFSSEDQCFYVVPDQVSDKHFDPRDGRKAKWVDDNDDPDDLGGHWELLPEDSDHVHPAGEPMELDPAEAAGGSDFG